MLTAIGLSRMAAYQTVQIGLGRFTMPEVVGGLAYCGSHRSVR